MEFNQNIILDQKQQLNMTPQLAMAIKLLQYSTLELKDYIEEMVKENPLLEKLEDDNSKKSENNLNNANNNYENFMSREERFTDYVERQLYQYLPENELKIGRYIIGNLNEQGFLKIEYNNIAEIFQINSAKVEEIVKKIQRLDPPGIAAKNFQESLLIQLKMMAADTTLEQTIVKNYIAELAEGNLNLIAGVLNISELKIKQSVQAIKKLNPYPTAGFYQGEDIKYIIPDLIVQKFEGDYLLEDNHVLPGLKINNYYYKLLKNCHSTEELDYLKERYRAALWLINSIEQRRKTISKIANVIIRKQSLFLDKGIKYLCTLTLNDIAKLTNVHESTVSRAINGKYIQTPQGLFELKFFFNSGIENYSSYSIKAYISDIIKGEDSCRPLSDREISSLLSRKLKITISRRTVAKYRSELGLPPSCKRKGYNS
ncbi:MAG: RNA polymerase factor sigma-54 [Halanaerobiales bacterium]